MKNQCENTKIVIEENTAMICSADGHQENAARKTPEQIAHELIVYYVSEKYPVTHKALENRIALEIREAVELEREACANIADDAHKDEEYGHAAFRCVQISQAIRSRTE